MLQCAETAIYMYMLSCSPLHTLPSYMNNTNNILQKDDPTIQVFAYLGSWSVLGGACPREVISNSRDSVILTKITCQILRPGYQIDVCVFYICHWPQHCQRAAVVPWEIEVIPEGIWRLLWQCLWQNSSFVNTRTEMWKTDVDLFFTKKL